MREIELVLLLLVLVTALTLVARRFTFPYPIVMVLGGLLLSQIPALPAFELPPELVFFVFLPPLLFAGGYFTSLRDFKANLRPIFLLAFGLVIFTAGAVAVVAHMFVPTLGWAGAFALGAIVSPPDAVAATAIFQRMGVPRRIVTILEGESLVNDATALVIYRFAVAAAAAGTFSLIDAGGSFFVVLLGGLAVGVVVGRAGAWILARIRDTGIAVMVTLLAPFAAYLSAESIGVSGVLATVVGGLFARSWLRQSSSDTRIVGFSAWQMVLFLLNGLVFMLIGLQLPSVIRGVSADPAEVATIAVAGGLRRLVVGSSRCCVARRGPRASGRLSGKESDPVPRLRDHPRHPRRSGADASACHQEARCRLHGGRLARRGARAWTDDGGRPRSDRGAPREMAGAHRAHRSAARSVRAPRAARRATPRERRRRGAGAARARTHQARGHRRRAAGRYQPPRPRRHNRRGAAPARARSRPRRP